MSNQKTKTFPKARVCVIDIYPSFEEGLKKAIKFSQEHNIMLNSADGRKLIVSYCIKAIENDYTQTSSPFPKVLCMASEPINKKIQTFIDNYFKSIMKYVPMPYCGAIKLESPDLESAAENSLKQQKTQRKFQKLSTRLKLK
jgi:hypothetical protein